MRNKVPTPLQACLFFLLIIGLTFGVGVLLGVSSAPLRAVKPFLLECGAASVVVLPIAYLFLPRVFSIDYWHLSPSLGWVGLAAGVQVVVNQTDFYPVPVNRYIAIGAVITAPVVEEVVRAVMMSSLVEAWGPVWATVTVTLLTTLIHPNPLHVFIGQFILSLLFLRSNRSIPTCILAHCLMNTIVVLHSGITNRQFRL